MTATFAASARAKGVAMPVSVAPDVPHGVYLDDLRMQQILGNLLGAAQCPPAALIAHATTHPAHPRPDGMRCWQVTRSSLRSAAR